MGCGASAATSAEGVASAAIDKQLKEEDKKQKAVVKILLLGTGASGKSTVCKQMRLLFLEGFNDKDRRVFRDPIVFNLLRNMMSVCEYAAQWGYAFQENLHVHAQRVQALQLTIGMELDKETGLQISALWRDPAAAKVLERAAETNLDDSLPYFMAQVGRIAMSDYVPSIEDILRCRIKTLGIVEMRFQYEGDASFLLVDVGGQRTERRKWIHAFDSVTLVLFVLALSEYDMLCEEDQATNRLVESLQLFDDVANRHFKERNMVVFYNKNDLFEEKIARVPFAKFHPDYKGPERDAEAVRQYIQAKVAGLDKSGPTVRSVYSHTTCATDTQQIKAVWSAVADVTLNQNLQRAGFAMS